MPYISDTKIDLTGQSVTSNYIISSQHRRVGNPNKSIWTISFEDEVTCFVHTITNKWKIGPDAWGIKVIGDILQVVGLNNDKQELKIARFVDGTNTDIWHGYPADYMRKSKDRPSTAVLKSWVKSGFITKAKMSKIRTGQSCNL